MKDHTMDLEVMEPQLCDDAHAGLKEIVLE